MPYKNPDKQREAVRVASQKFRADRQVDFIELDPKLKKIHDQILILPTHKQNVATISLLKHLSSLVKNSNSAAAILSKAPSLEGEALSQCIIEYTDRGVDAGEAEKLCRQELSEAQELGKQFAARWLEDTELYMKELVRYEVQRYTDKIKKQMDEISKAVAEEYRMFKKQYPDLLNTAYLRKYFATVKGPITKSVMADALKKAEQHSRVRVSISFEDNDGVEGEEE
jgi:hypothetical protein